jgi:hypothetical protein
MEIFELLLEYKYREGYSDSTLVHHMFADRRIKQFNIFPTKVDNCLKLLAYIHDGNYMGNFPRDTIKDWITKKKLMVKLEFDTLDKIPDIFYIIDNNYIIKLSKNKYYIYKQSNSSTATYVLKSLYKIDETTMNILAVSGLNERITLDLVKKLIKNNKAVKVV